MIVSINQPAYLPWLGYYDRIANSDLHVVLDHVQFEKNSFTNRNRIRNKQGAIWLTVPIITSGRYGNLAINTLEIANSSNWRNKHWASLQSCYSRSTYFSFYKEMYQSIYLEEWRMFMPFVRKLLLQQLFDLGITTPLVFSSELEVSGSKSDLVLNICTSLGADVYLSGPHGRNYINERAFSEAGIIVSYQDYLHPSYSQCWPGFESNLSALDLLFNHGAASLDIIKKARRSNCAYGKA